MRMVKRQEPSYDQMDNCFFKIMIGNFAKELRIPPAFLKHLEHENSNKFVLEGPSGKLWHLTVERTPNSMVLQNGWEKFVKDHSLESGDFLVFQYSGGLHFTVQIFDRTACEKKDLSEVGYGEEQEDVTEVPVQDFEVPQSKSCKAVQKRDGRGQPSASKTVNFTSRKSEIVKNITENFAGEPIDSYLPSKDKGVPKRSSYRYKEIVSTRRPVTEAEKIRAYEAAKSFKPSKPYFMVVMKPTHVYRGFNLRIPKIFSKNYCSHETKTISLSDPSGRISLVSCLYSNVYEYRARLSGGWKSFCLMNNLEEGDVCIFELVDDCNFDVHIFRVLDITQPSTL